MDLSIIVPVYNMELYLEKCLSTLVNQNNNNYSYEIICVNDGSTDKSQEILELYREKYNKTMKIIVTENLGVSNARNIGIENSSGEYITFVDSDDWIDEDFVCIALDNIKQYGVDLCVFDTVYVYNENIYHKEVIADTIFNTENHACGKIFKRSIIDEHGIKFPMGISIGEDLAFTFSYICAINDYKHISKGMYYYRQSRDGSAMTSQIKNKYKEVNEAAMAVYNFSERNNLLEKNFREIEYLFIKNIIIRSTMKILNNNRNLIKIYKEIKEQVDFVENIFSDWKNNIHIIKDSDGYLSSKLGSNYIKVLNNIDCNIVRTIVNFILGKFIL